MQIENLEHVSPATVCQIGLMCMTKEDVSWKLLINRWISKKQEREAEVLRSLCDRYIGPTLEFLSARTSVPPRPGAAPTNTKYKVLEHIVCTSEINMVETLIALVDVSVQYSFIDHEEIFSYLYFISLFNKSLSVNLNSSCLLHEHYVPNIDI